MPNKQMRTTYEQLKLQARVWYGAVANTSDMIEKAISERGGHCLQCTCKSKLIAVKPSKGPCVIRSQDLSVQVKCDADPFRRYPFRSEESLPTECPSLKRHIRLQQKIEIAV
jgi:hypothetical protein